MRSVHLSLYLVALSLAEPQRGSAFAGFRLHARQTPLTAVIEDIKMPIPRTKTNTELRSR
eukprot:1650641-Amphidinium_carterae.1